MVTLFPISVGQDGSAEKNSRGGTFQRVSIEWRDLSVSSRPAKGLIGGKSENESKPIEIIKEGKSIQ